MSIKYLYVTENLFRIRYRLYGSISFLSCLYNTKKIVIFIIIIVSNIAIIVENYQNSRLLIKLYLIISIDLLIAIFCVQLWRFITLCLLDLKPKQWNRNVYRFLSNRIFSILCYPQYNEKTSILIYDILLNSAYVTYHKSILYVLMSISCTALNLSSHMYMAQLVQTDVGYYQPLPINLFTLSPLLHFMRIFIWIFT